eukprot:364577-Chlamydomonas_euryale.AAC.8
MCRFCLLPQARAYIRALPPAEKIDFKRKFPEADPLAIDLMEKMLQFDPRCVCHACGVGSSRSGANQPPPRTPARLQISPPSLSLPAC